MLVLRTVAVVALGGLIAAESQAGPSAPPSTQPASQPAAKKSTPAPASQPTWKKPAHLRIRFENHTGPLFRLVKLEVALDNILIYRRTDDTDKLQRSKNLEIYDGAVAPVFHTVSLKLVFRGTAMGLFTYRREYIYTLRRSHEVAAGGPGSRTTVNIKGYMRGNIFWRPGNRLAVEFVRGK